MSNSLNHSVGPDLDPNCLQKLSAKGTSRQRVQINAICGSSQQYFSHVETLALNLCQCLVSKSLECEMLVKVTG